jgi:hypothetical protein
MLTKYIDPGNLGLFAINLITGRALHALLDSAQQQGVGAALIYLGVTLLVPVLHAWLSGRGWIDTRYALWTVVVPLAALLTYGLGWSRLRRGFIEPGRQVDQGQCCCADPNQLPPSESQVFTRVASDASMRMPGMRRLRRGK